MILRSKKLLKMLSVTLLVVGALTWLYLAPTYDKTGNFIISGPRPVVIQGPGYIIFNGEINDYSSAQISKVLRSLEYGEVLTIYMNSPGGYVTNIAEIMNGLDNTKGYVHIHVTGQASSGGAVMCMLADRVTFDTYTEAMVHMAGMYVGDQRVVNNTDPLCKVINRLIYQKMVVMYGKPVADSLYKGTDYYVLGADFDKALERIGVD